MAYRHEEDLDSDDEINDLPVWGRDEASEEEAESEESDSESDGSSRLGSPEPDEGQSKFIILVSYYVNLGVLCLVKRRRSLKRVTGHYYWQVLSPMKGTGNL